MWTRRKIIGSGLAALGAPFIGKGEPVKSVLGADGAKLTEGDVPITAASYVQDGLIAMWDGIENAGWGVHDEEATVWKDLVGDIDLTIYGEVLWNCVRNSTTAAAEALGKTVGNISTIEVCYKCNSLQGQQGLVFYSGTISSSQMGLVQYGPDVGFQNYSDKFWSYPFLTDSVRRTIAATTSAFFVNGEALAPATHSTDSWSNGQHTGVGGRQWQNTWKTYGEYYCIRCYSRNLAAEEIGYNYQMDAERFGL